MGRRVASRSRILIACGLVACAAALRSASAAPALSADDQRALVYVRSVHGATWGRSPRPGFGNEPPLRSRLGGVMRREELAVGALVAERVRAADPEYVGLDAAIQLRQLSRLCALVAERRRGDAGTWSAYLVRAEKLSRLTGALGELFAQSARHFRRAESGQPAADAARRKVQAMLALAPVTEWVRQQKQTDLNLLNELADRLAPMVLALISADGEPLMAKRVALALPAAAAGPPPAARPATAADARALAEKVRADKLDARLTAQLLRQLAILELVLDRPASRTAATGLLAVVRRIRETGLRIAALPVATDRMKTLLTARLTFAANRFDSPRTRGDGLRRLSEIEQALGRFGHLQAVVAADPALGKTLAGHLERAMVLLQTEDTREKGSREHDRLWQIAAATGRLYWATGRCKRACLALGGFCRDAEQAAAKLAAAAVDVAIGKAPLQPPPGDGGPPAKPDEKDEKDRKDPWPDAIRPIQILAADAAGVHVLMQWLAALAKDIETAPRNRKLLDTALGVEGQRLLREETAAGARRTFSTAVAIASSLGALGRAREDADTEALGRSLAGGAYTRAASRARRAGRLLLESFGKDPNRERDLAAACLFNFADLGAALHAAARLRAHSDAVTAVSRLRTYQFSTKVVGEAYKALLKRIKDQLALPATVADRRAPDNLAGTGRLLGCLNWILAHDGGVRFEDDAATRLAAAVCLKLDPKAEAESLRLQLGAYVNEGLARLLEGDLRQASRYADPAAQTLEKLRAALGE